MLFKLDLLQLALFLLLSGPVIQKKEIKLNLDFELKLSHHNAQPNYGFQNESKKLGRLFIYLRKLPALIYIF